MTKRNLSTLGVCLFLSWFLFSCGLENVPFIDRVPDPVHTDLSGANEVRLPDFWDDVLVNFSHFVIFYRIYVSNHNPISVNIGDDTQLRDINTMLSANVTTLRAWVEPDSIQNMANVRNTFVNMGFFQLELEGAVVNNILGPNSLGGTLDIDFADVTGQVPRLLLRNRNGEIMQYDLRRAGGIDRDFEFDPLPEFDGALPFFNHDELRDNENRRPENLRNADVATVFPANSENAFVIMYIAVSGLNNEVPPRLIFSQPTFLGLFRLPNSH